MKFIVRRASDWSLDDLKPIEGAKLETVAILEKCHDTFSLLMKDDVRKEWYSKGYGHYSNDNHEYFRKHDKKFWTIEVNTLEELMKIVEKEDIVLYNKYDGLEIEGYKYLLIYDDLIEE